MEGLGYGYELIHKKGGSSSKFMHPEQPCTATGDICSVILVELLASTQEKHLALRDHGDRQIGVAATQRLMMMKGMLYYFPKNMESRVSKLLSPSLI